MNCELAHTTLHGYLDAELDAVRATEFQSHLETCAECRAALQSFSSLGQGLRRSDLYVPASSGLRSEIMRGLGAESRERETRARWRWLLVPAFSAAALITIWTGVLLVNKNSYSARMDLELVDAHVRSLQPGHLMDVQSSDQHTVKPWFDGKLDFVPPVSDFSQQGFSLVGGRLDILGAHNVAALVYARRKHLINVFVWPVDRGPRAFDHTGTRQGYNWLSWRAGDMQFCAVSDASEGDLLQLKELIRP
jgi:anti-sigma factor RsiW